MQSYTQASNGIAADLCPVTVDVPLLLSSAERGRGGKEKKKELERKSFNLKAVRTVSYCCWVLRMRGQALSGGSAQPACLVPPALCIICVCAGLVNRSAGGSPASLNPFYISILKSNFRSMTSFFRWI